MLTIYTHSTNPIHREFWKPFIKRAVGKYTGPNAVRDSLIRGLEENNVTYELNPINLNNGTVLVLSGVKALKKIIASKRFGEISKLIVGPNLVSTPYEKDGVILDDAIDSILVPSEWVSSFWKREAPEISSKIHVWASGVSKVGASTRTGTPIVYNKIQNKRLLNIANEIIKSTGKTPKVFTYGTYKHSEYLEAMSDAPYLVYLSQSESQGLALQESWAHDVPTFVNKSTKWQKGKYSFKADKINAPYLTDELGGIFTNEEDLSLLIDKANVLHPKLYCDRYLSDNASVNALLKII